MKPKTPKDIILPVILPPEDQHKIVVSRCYSINPESQHLGLPLSPYYHECNIRIDWGTDGGIYRVVWANVEKKPQRPVKSYTNNSPQYATEDMSTKPQNVYTSEERVHEIDIRKAAEMALVALDHTARSAVEQYVIEQQVVTFLKQALAQPEQEPYADKANQLNSDRMQIDPVTGDVSIGTPSKPEQDRTTWNGWVLREVFFDNGEPLGHREPPSKPKEWVSLTDEEIENISGQIERSDFFDCVIPFAKAIEAALRSKNNG